jgi:hypothetical protein
MNNDSTVIGPQGASYVDFCLVPYKNLNKFNYFEVIKNNRFNCLTPKLSLTLVRTL